MPKKTLPSREGGVRVVLLNMWPWRASSAPNKSVQFLKLLGTYWYLVKLTSKMFQLA